MSTPISWEEALDRAAQNNYTNARYVDSYFDFESLIDHAGMLPPDRDGDRYVDTELIKTVFSIAAELFAEARAEDAAANAWNSACDAASRVIDGWPSNIMTLSEMQEEILKLKDNYRP